MEKNITIIQGQVFQGDKKIGEAVKDFKFGYHPAVLATFKTERRWFELDESDLLTKVMEFFRENIKRRINMLKETAQRLLSQTNGCRHDMHEPDEQNLKARVIGDKLDNAFGNSIREVAILNGWQEFVVILERDFGPKGGGRYIDKFNLASLIALARIGARNMIDE